MKRRALSIPMAAILVSCLQLEDPQAVDLADTFRVVPSDTVIPADGNSAATLIVDLVGKAQANLKVVLQTDVGRFAGASQTIELSFAGNRASALLVADTLPRSGTVRASINGVTRYLSVRFAPTQAGALHLVPEKLAAVANGSDAISINVHVVPPPSGQYVSRGQPVELIAFDSMRVELPELRRLGVYSGSLVNFRVVSSYEGETLVVARMGVITSDTLRLMFNPP